MVWVVGCGWLCACLHAPLLPHPPGPHPCGGAAHASSAPALRGAHLIPASSRPLALVGCSFHAVCRLRVLLPSATATSARLAYRSARRRRPSSLAPPLLLPHRAPGLACPDELLRAAACLTSPGRPCFQARPRRLFTPPRPRHKGTTARACPPRPSHMGTPHPNGGRALNPTRGPHRDPNQRKHNIGEGGVVRAASQMLLMRRLPLACLS